MPGVWRNHALAGGVTAAVLPQLRGQRAAGAALVGALALATAACGGNSGESGRPTETQPFDCPARTTGDQVVTIFHETHTHGRLAGTHEREHNVPFARFVGLWKALRSCLAQPDASLFVGNGDDLSIDLNGVVTEGEHTIAAFNAAEVDVNTFGFSETEVLGVLRERVAASQFTWVSANVREADSPDEVFAAAQGARPWVIEEVGGVQVGITGLRGVRFSPDYPPREEEGIRVVDEVKAMKQVLPQMRAEGAQVVVLLSHMSHEDTLRVVRAVKGIDVALGTHVGPPTLEPDEVDGTIVAVAGPDELQGLGQLDLIVRDGSIEDYVWRRHVPSPSDPVDRRVQAVVADYLRAA
jgi:2',3'-cyclic-nucleotide 2'-phosphodiesterase/3'-nucleotidase